MSFIYEVFNILTIILFMMIFMILVLSFVGLFNLFLSNLVLNIKNNLNLNVVNLNSSFLVSMVFVLLYIFLNISFLPWGHNILLNNLFILGFSLFLMINIITLSFMNYGFHLVGKSESMIMAMFFYFIHLLGDLMKPLSLSLRLFINLTFGHILILTLYNSFGPSFYSIPFMFYELFVFGVQTFIFVTMLRLYSH